MPYRDDYPTCASTYATLRIYHKSDSPNVVTSALALDPADSQTVGSPEPEKGRIYKLSGWFLTTDEIVASRDLRHHLDWLIERIEDKREALQTLRANGWWMDISCWWMSQSGHGGPTLSPRQMAVFGDLGVEIWFDVYFRYAPCLDSNGNVIAPAEPYNQTDAR